MTIPVLWPARGEEFKARGYADQALLEAVLSRELWRPPNALTFEHYEVRDEFPDVDGALVIFNGRANVADADWLIDSIHALEWSVVILCGDEEHAFPTLDIGESETRRLWVMAPGPQHHGVSYRIPGGWYPHTREGLRAARDEAETRPLDWFFAGQINHVRREEMVAELEKLQNGYLYGTEGFYQGMAAAEYLALTASAKVIPCPSGPVTVDTARPLSAMEAGCVPICDTIRPHAEPQFPYWQVTFGQDFPCPRLDDWSQLPYVLEAALDGWPANANRIWSWWMAWKRQTAKKLDEDIKAVSGWSIRNVVRSKAGNPMVEDPDDLVTAIITTSPIPAHPSTADIEETIRSVRAQLPDCEIVIVADGVRPEQEHRRDDYEDYLRHLLWLCNFEWHNVVPVVLDEWVHQANATRRALELVTTPLVLFVEHDTPLVGEIDWPGLCEFVQSGAANSVRFLEDTAISPSHASIMLDAETKWVNGEVPVRRTTAWWARPSLGSTRWWREKLMPLFGRDARTMLEEVIYSVVAVECQVHGEAGWWDWRLWCYTPEGDMRRSGHLDSRGSDQKYKMLYSYDGPVPKGAPMPGVR